MPKVKFYLPQEIKTFDTFLMCDSAWSILFPNYWGRYRSKGSFKNAAKIKVLGLERGTVPEGYVVELMEIAPQVGRLVIPVGIRETVTERQIHLALALTHKLRLE